MEERARKAEEYMEREARKADKKDPWSLEEEDWSIEAQTRKMEERARKAEEYMEEEARKAEKKDPSVYVGR